MLIHLKVVDFIEELASDSPAPGGGSASALAGSLGAALASMVANLTVGKEKFKEHEKEIQLSLDTATRLKNKLTSLVDEDTEAFNRVMAAFKMPKAKDEEKKARSKAIQEAMQHAAKIPMEVAEACLEILVITELLVKKGNPNALSDGGVGALMAAAGVQGAVFNVRINLGSIKDEAFVKEMSGRAAEIENKAVRLRDEIVKAVNEKLS